MTECVIPDSIEQPAVGETPMIESSVQAEASSGAVHPSEPEDGGQLNLEPERKNIRASRVVRPASHLKDYVCE